MTPKSVVDWWGFGVEESRTPTPTINLKEELEEKKERIKKKLQRPSDSEKEEDWPEVRERKKVCSCVP
jgi:hypothetical protein